MTYPLIAREGWSRILLAFGLASAVEKGKLTQEEAESALSKITFTEDGDELNNADVLIEAIPERFDLKVSF